jgi:hypothetical protein
LVKNTEMDQTKIIFILVSQGDICFKMFHNQIVFTLTQHTRSLNTNLPLIVFGCNDIRRQFYIIAFMFTSHETEIDFTHFYKSLRDLCNVFEIHFAPCYMMQDADKAMANAVKAVFPLCKILMCYYHLRANVSKAN